MNALGARIARLIEMQGPIPVSEFMTIALHDPELGYYARRDPIGARGDFITAPEVSQMFGELLGLWCVQVWRDQGRPSPARLVELGPGRGALMADALRAARLDPEFLASTEIVLVETGPVLRRRQSESLRSYSNVRWADRFDESLADRPLFLVANEFFDALPIRQFVKTERGWPERMVALDCNGDLAFALSPNPVPLDVPSHRGDAELGAAYEVSPPRETLIEQIARAIVGQGGAALIVDYGYGVQSGFGDTLQAVSKHGFAGVLDAPGEADLSAHVDFAALTRTAECAGAAAYGPLDQRELLERLGVRERAERLMHANPGEAASIAAAVERLTSAKAMGALFKAMAISSKAPPSPPGF